MPLKPLTEAKSRLRGVTDDHESLVLALAAATVGAALRADLVARVVVITRDQRAAGELRRLGAHIHTERALGLNAALVEAARQVPGPVAVLPADIPALREAELSQALLAAAGIRAFVPDASGLGTVLLAAPMAGDLNPRFGAASAREHERSGAYRLAQDWPTLRRDVDTAEDLAQALALGWLPAPSV